MERENRIVAYQSIIAGIRQIIVSGRKFYLAFPNRKIVNACVHNLDWMHFRSLLRTSDLFAYKGTVACGDKKEIF